MIIYADVLRNALVRSFFLTGVIALPACDSNFTPPDNMAGSSLSAYNFSAEGIQEYFVDGAWGGGVGIGSGGGQVCCINIPRKWHDKLQVTVEWRRSDCGVPKSPLCNHENAVSGKWPKKTLKKTVPVEPYSEPGVTQVVFLPQDEIKIFVSNMDIGHLDHPSKFGDIAPHPLTDEELQRLMKK